MKTTIKLGMLTAAFLLAFASCSNIVKDPVAANDNVAKSVIDQGLTNGREFKVTNVVGAPYGLIATTENAQYQVKITFSHRPDKKTMNGITFRSLENATDATSMPKTKQKYEPAKTEFADNDVYFTFNFKPSDVTDFYVFIDAKTVKAENGAGLNHDGDCKWGEGGVGGDDSYAWILFPKTGSTGVTGNVNYDQETGTPTNKVWSWGGAFQLKGGTGADAYKITKAVVTVVSNAALADSSTVNGFFDPLIKKHVKVQHYDWKNGKWVDVSAVFTRKLFDVWEADISIPDGHYARFKFVDLVELKDKSYRTKLYGYPIKFKLEECANFDGVVVTNSSVYSSVPLATDTSFWPASNLTATKSAGKVSLKFNNTTLPAVNAAGNNVYFNNAWHTVSANNKLSGSQKTLFKGFDESTVKAKNFKCYNAAGKLMPIKSVTAIKSDVGNYPEALNEIVILLEHSSEAPASVYMSPDVKTSSFEGSDDSAPVKGYNIPALSFAENKPYATSGVAGASESPEEKGLGWRKF